jgi:Tfp pilus assembly protein PilF
VSQSQEHVSIWPALPRQLRGRTFWLGALLVAVTSAVYWPVCRFEFLVFDDPAYVTENAHVLAGLTLGGIRWAFATFRDANWIPLTWLSLMVDATMYGPRPGGYHVTNLLLHLANVLLVLAAFTRLTGSPLRSAFVAGLFAVHPLHVESVAWIAERKDVLSVLFGLLSLNAYVAYAQNRRLALFAASWVCFVCSLLSKQTLVTLPFVFLLLDFAPLGRTRLESARRLAVEKIPFLVASAAFCAIALFAQSDGRAVRSLTVVPLANRCLNAIFVYGLYAWRALFPLNLAPFYPHPGARLRATEVILVLAILSAFTCFCVANVRRRPFVLVGWLWYLGTLVPMIGLVQIGGQQMADRYLYFPALGLYAAVAWVLPSSPSVSPVRRWLLPTVATAVVATYAGLAFIQTGYWSESVTLFRHALAVTDDNALARSALGSALLEQGQFDEAIVHLKKAAELDPADAQVHFLLGSGLQGDDCLREAAAEYRTSLAIDDCNASAHNNLGLILFQGRHYAEAQQEFVRALEEDENDQRALVNLALLYGELHDYEHSLQYSQRALALDPSLDVCRRLIAVARRAQGRFAEAQSLNRGFH